MIQPSKKQLPLSKSLKVPFFNNIKEHRNKNIVVSFSGGADSAILLRLVMEFKRFFKSVSIYHFNHKIRTTPNNGISDTDRDEMFARNTASDNNINYILSEAVDDIVTENDARMARWGALSDNIPRDAVVFTGHHKDDVAENVLMKIFRGAGSNGVSGMKVDRNNGFCNICSPLSFLDKDEINAACDKFKVLHVIDKSNFENDFSRNKVRNLVIPEIKKIWPDFNDKIISFRDTISSEGDALSEIIRSIIHKSSNGYPYNFSDFSDDTQVNVLFEIFKLEGINGMRKSDLYEIVNIIKKRKSTTRVYGTYSLEFKGNHISIIPTEKP